MLIAEMSGIDRCLIQGTADFTEEKHLSTHAEIGVLCIYTCEVCSRSCLNQH